MKELDNNSIFDIFNVFNFFSPEGIINAGSKENFCMVIGEKSGWYGYELNSFGEANPDHTGDGQLLYSFVWDEDGNFTIQFGSSGDEQVPGVFSIVIYSPTFQKARLAQWNSNSKQYTFEDKVLSDDLIDQFNLGVTDFCIYIGNNTGLVLNYTYDTFLIGTGTDTYSFLFATKQVSTKFVIDTKQNQSVMLNGVRYNGASTIYASSILLRFTEEPDGAIVYFDCRNNQLHGSVPRLENAKVLRLGGNNFEYRGPIHIPSVETLEMDNNNLSSEDVDYILIDLNDADTQNAVIDLRQNAIPSQTGFNAKESLESRGCIVYVDE